MFYLSKQFFPLYFQLCFVKFLEWITWTRFKWKYIIDLISTLIMFNVKYRFWWWKRFNQFFHFICCQKTFVQSFINWKYMNKISRKCSNTDIDDILSSKVESIFSLRWLIQFVSTVCIECVCTRSNLSKYRNMSRKIDILLHKSLQMY